MLPRALYLLLIGLLSVAALAATPPLQPVSVTMLMATPTPAPVGAPTATPSPGPDSPASGVQQVIHRLFFPAETLG